MAAANHDYRLPHGDAFLHAQPSMLSFGLPQIWENGLVGDQLSMGSCSQLH